MNIERVHTDLNTKIDRVHTDLNTKIDRVLFDFNQFSLNSIREIKSIHDTLHLMHDFVTKVLHLFTLLLFYMLIPLINLV